MGSHKNCISKAVAIAGAVAALCFSSSVAAKDWTYGWPPQGCATDGMVIVTFASPPEVSRICEQWALQAKLRACYKQGHIMMPDPETVTSYEFRMLFAHEMAHHNKCVHAVPDEQPKKPLADKAVS